MRFVSSQDPEIDALLDLEVERQQDELELIASENYASPAVIAAMGSLLTNKYAEGLPGKRYYGGCEVVDRVEQIAIDRALKLFGAAGANVQPHSGAQANAAMYQALLQPGDTILGLDLSHGGHLTHGSPVNFSGQVYRAVHYGLDPATGRIDMNQVRERALAERPKVIVTGASAYPRTIDFAAFARIADEVGALLVADIAHIAGLVVAGLHPSPIPHCAMVSTTTHKTLRGPRGGLLMADATRVSAMNKAVFPGIQGGPLMHVIAAKAIAFGEALTPSFHAYAGRVVDNAAALAEGLVARGFTLVSGGTDNHLMLVDLGERCSGKEAEAALSRAAITVNKNTVPGERRSPFVTSGIRIGTPAMTTRGFGVDDARQVASWIADVLDARDDAAVISRVRGEVVAACRARPVPGASLHEG
jgi:glycine hydroxymethyltransferase